MFTAVSSLRSRRQHHQRTFLASRHTTKKPRVARHFCVKYHAPFPHCTPLVRALNNGKLFLPIPSHTWRGRTEAFVRLPYHPPVVCFCLTRTILKCTVVKGEQNPFSVQVHLLGNLNRDQLGDNEKRHARTCRLVETGAQYTSAGKRARKNQTQSN